MSLLVTSSLMALCQQLLRTPAAAAVNVVENEDAARVLAEATHSRHVCLKRRQLIGLCASRPNTKPCKARLRPRNVRLLCCSVAVQRVRCQARLLERIRHSRTSARLLLLASPTGSQITSLFRGCSSSPRLCEYLASWGAVLKEPTKSLVRERSC